MGGSFARTGVPNALTSASYNANNQLTQLGPSNLTYDANGNLTSDGVNTYTWDARNHLISSNGAVSANFQYDAFGRRVSRDIGNAGTSYLYDGMNPVQELSGAAVTASTLTGLGVDEYFQRTDSSGTWNYLADALGSTIALTNSAGTLQTQYTYEPFGNTSVTGGLSINPFQFTGRENDSAGLYFYRARYYAPSAERFLSEDPLRFGDSTATNFFVYVGDDPIGWVDPYGLTAQDCKTPKRDCDAVRDDCRQKVRNYYNKEMQRIEKSYKTCDRVCKLLGLVPAVGPILQKRCDLACSIGKNTEQQSVVAAAAEGALICNAIYAACQQQNAGK